VVKLATPAGEPEAAEDDQQDDDDEKPSSGGHGTSKKLGSVAVRLAI